MVDYQSVITHFPNHDDIYMPTRIFAYILLHMPYYKPFLGVPSFNGCSLGKWTKVPKEFWCQLTQIQQKSSYLITNISYNYLFSCRPCWIFILDFSSFFPE